MSDWKQMLREAKELFDDGIIDEDEFKQLKTEAFALRSQTTSGVSTTGGGQSTTDTFAGGQTQFQAVGQTIGQYRVLGEMGKGGMGTVYRARHKVDSFAQQTGDVVIKLMNPQVAKDESFRQRFISEAAMGRNIHHPNIVRIHDVIVEEERNVLAIVMDLVEGRPLEDMIPKTGMSMERAL